MSGMGGVSFLLRLRFPSHSFAHWPKDEYTSGILPRSKHSYVVRSLCRRKGEGFKDSQTCHSLVRTFGNFLRPGGAPSDPKCFAIIDRSILPRSLKEPLSALRLPKAFAEIAMAPMMKRDAVVRDPTSCSLWKLSWLLVHLRTASLSEGQTGGSASFSLMWPTTTTR